MRKGLVASKQFLVQQWRIGRHGYRTPQHSQEKAETRGRQGGLNSTTLLPKKPRTAPPARTIGARRNTRDSLPGPLTPPPRSWYRTFQGLQSASRTWSGILKRLRPWSLS